MSCADVFANLSGIVLVQDRHDDVFMRAAKPLTDVCPDAFERIGRGFTTPCNVYLLRAYTVPFTDALEDFVSHELRGGLKKDVQADVSVQWYKPNGDTGAYRIVLSGEMFPMYCVGGTSSPRCTPMPNELEAYQGNVYDWLLDQAKKQWGLRSCFERVSRKLRYTMCAELPKDVPEDD